MSKLSFQKAFQTWPNFQKQIPAKSLTTFGLGGKLAWYLPVYSEKSLIEAISQAKKFNLPYHLLAGGSNVVFGDGLINKLLIHYQSPVKKGRTILKTNDSQIEAEAGIPLADLITFANNQALAGLESLAGIPGTVGGAIVGNAGAYGRSISDYLTEIFIHDGQNSYWLPKAKGRFKYRHSIFKEKDYLLLKARFQLPKGEKNKLKQISREIIKTRQKKYEPGLACPGSFFKNILFKELSPESRRKIDKSKVIKGKVPAGYLLEAVGACGLRRGKITVASWHGNLLINQGGGSYRELKLLSRELKKRVKTQFNITLEEEVRYML